MNATLIVLCICGLLMHFLGSYGESFRTNARIGPFAFIAREWPKWMAAVIGSLVCMLMLNDLIGLLGAAQLGQAKETILRVLAFTAGYTGSSIAAKLPAFLPGGGQR